MKYLITGLAGSGKTALSHELRRRGYESLDTDKYPGLTRWEDTHTGHPVKVDSRQYVDYSKVDWNWQTDILQKILNSSETIFLCGSASNQQKFQPLFDKVFVLDVEPANQLKRLRSRPDGYAKDPRQQTETIKEQAGFLKRLASQGAEIIDANQLLTKVVDDILEKSRV